VRCVVAILFLAIAASAESLASKLFEVTWTTNYLVDEKLAIRSDLSIPVTNVVKRFHVHKLGPGLPMFTNATAVATNVVIVTPRKKPLRSPKNQSP